MDIRSLFVRYSAPHRLTSPTPSNAKIGFALSALFAKNVVSLCRFVAFLFFVRETVETLRLSHISLSFTSSYKVSSKFQSSIFFLLFISDIATLFMFFYPACSFFCFTCSFSDLACINLPVYFVLPCLFFIQACIFFIFLVSFLPKTSLKKDTTLCFHYPHPCALYFVLLSFSFSLSCTYTYTHKKRQFRLIVELPFVSYDTVLIKSLNSEE